MVCTIRLLLHRLVRGDRMTIHVVAQGETLYFIAAAYGVAVEILARYNGLQAPYTLAVGQSILILHPTEVYTVRPGDTIYSIAGKLGVTPLEVLQRNPNLGGRAALYPGQVLVIRLKEQPQRQIFVNGYAYPFVNLAVLQEILPYASALTPFTYGIRADGGLVTLEDTSLIAAAKEYQCLPLMHLSTLTEQGSFSSERAMELLRDSAQMERLAELVTAQVLARGYQGVDLDFEYIQPEYATAYGAFAGMLRARLNALGFPLFVALVPKTSADQPGLLYEGHDYRLLGENSDAVLVMTYEWGYTYGSAMAVAPLASVRRVLDYAVTEIAPEKILMGFPNYAYDWTLPYRPGESRARLISNEDAVALAVRMGAEIQFDETAETPWFFYTAQDGTVHEVWFEDARSAYAKFQLVNSYGLRGIGYWNFMRPFTQGFSLQQVMFTVERSES